MLRQEVSVLCELRFAGRQERSQPQTLPRSIDPETPRDTQIKKLRHRDPRKKRAKDFEVESQRIAKSSDSKASKDVAVFVQGRKLLGVSLLAD